MPETPQRRKLLPSLRLILAEDWGSEFVCQLGLFDVHVLEFAGFEDFGAFQAFNEF
jgi:hypothetical protein